VTDPSQSSAGAVIFVVGVPASGKTTLAQGLILELRRRGVPTLWLDSDDLRAVLTPAPTFSDPERDWFYGAIGHLAWRAAQGGVTVVISATASRRRYRDELRARVRRFVEVWLTCGDDVLRTRDPKGLYRAAAAGSISRLPGAGAAFEAPLAAELTFDTSVGDVSQRIDEVLRWLDTHA
jgi:adenylylsulfate kinase